MEFCPTVANLTVNNERCISGCTFSEAPLPSSCVNRGKKAYTSAWVILLWPVFLFSCFSVESERESWSPITPQPHEQKPARNFLAATLSFSLSFLLNLLLHLNKSKNWLPGARCPLTSFAVWPKSVRERVTKTDSAQTKPPVPFNPAGRVFFVVAAKVATI